MSESASRSAQVYRSSRGAQIDSLVGDGYFVRTHGMAGPKTQRDHGATQTAQANHAPAVTIFVPGLLRDRCDGAAELKMSAADVRSALEQVETRYPSLYGSVCDETGAVRRHVNIFVNIDNTRDLDGIDTPLNAGDVITILPAVSGG